MNGRSSIDDIIDLYRRDIDVTLIRENLKLTPEQRLQKLVARAKFTQELHEAGRKMRRAQAARGTARD